MDAEILSVLGKEVEIRAWRDTDNVFEATLTDADGSPTSLYNSDVTMQVVDRAGGMVRYAQTNTPPQHVDAVAGKTRFRIASEVFDSLTGQRAFTWKYQIVRKDLATGSSSVYFWGDFRVMPMVTPIP